jgi:hypothetical protein
MTFKKLYIKETKGNLRQIDSPSTYQISLYAGPGFEVYFTDEVGAKMVTPEMLTRTVSFDELPKPLLKQIK